MKRMLMKRMLLAATLSASLGSVAVPAGSAVVIVREAPPPPRVERVPETRRGVVWAPGYWDWKRNRYVWVRGKWIRDRTGDVYNPPAWEERNGRWYITRSNWVRHDRDRDGVPNGLDARPNNPNRD